MKNLFGKRTAALILSFAMALALALPASATTEQKSVEVTTGVGLVINGLNAAPTDAAGNAAEPLYYDGTTYVPPAWAKPWARLWSGTLPPVL